MKKSQSLRPPRSSSESVSKVMRSNKSRNTKPEISIRNEIWGAGYRGYRTSWKKAPGRPDIAFVREKIAIIIHGCFWHGCKKCIEHLPKRNKRYWAWKMESNRDRDERDLRSLKKLGWRTFTIWEHDIKKGRTQRMHEWLKRQKSPTLS